MSNDIYQRSKKFIRNSKKIHDNKYDYSKVNYINAKTKVTIGCPDHGDFEQRPEKHYYRKHGCPSCAGTKKSSTIEFIIKARQVHGDTYEYVLVNYKGTYEKVQIVCHKHGVFKQTAKDHLNGCGCPKCGGTAQLTQNDFVMRSTKTHNNKYNYSLVNYITGRKKVIIICSHHGEFKQTPNAHMYGQGCPKCKPSGGYSYELFANDEDLKHVNGRIYLIQFTDIIESIQFLKIGITRSNIEDKFRSGFARYRYHTIIDKTMELYEAFCLEQNILRMFETTKFKPKKPFGGRTKCFTTQYKDQIIKTINSS